MPAEEQLPVPPSSQDGTTSISTLSEEAGQREDEPVPETAWRDPQTVEAIGPPPHQEIGLKELPSAIRSHVGTSLKNVHEAVAKMRDTPFEAVPVITTRLPDRWEYVEHTLSRANWIVEANVHGAEGWEMLSVEFDVYLDQHEVTREVRHNQVVKCIFKRRIS
jgi:hypothetical protein